MIPARFAPFLFGFLLSGMMSAIVSLVATLRSLGPVHGLLGIWASNWILAWAIAFPTVLVVAPLTRRIVARLVKAA